MDTRENQFEEELQKIKQTVKQHDSDELILKINNLKLDNQFKDSIIFNLVQKMDVKAVMEKVYLNELETIESYPQQLKYYVHFPYLLHGTLVILFYLRYKKLLNPTNTISVLCASSLLNEFGRYKRVQATNPQNFIKYKEASENYNYLMDQQLYKGGISFKDVMKYYFKIDIDSTYKRLKHMMFDDILNDDVITTQFF
ncbi:hypothetical protein TTHERM_00975400 (macronuclear) [Tetrahymena thermophila SB210]|uniref:Uncharacterized protein n=1 Tax=Tetrahymena thermophila (strain SB210) TaxID=312017 RepID=Q22WQ2_TETTS|nr:hypothetical protein TTHERM_00975400 [Tetrahymena thermophila SB210]EAR89740.2 hypothetical protein TTHERM_00975400 [Tetrahymena thermophila SB210]|eukprot:XP_001009985.2 hypothetical protein TTHERM_00975400 [Tetrahymena thermophila SB210]